MVIVTDIARVQIHTNFTGFVPTTIDLTLDDFADADTLGILRRIFTAPFFQEGKGARQSATASRNAL